ncbi:MAG TPA: hypothetical protein VMU60_11365 [Syntrophobacteria bacterium]|nr:hypothetical protein [Syntrophobacteria bacterium]
MARRDVSQPLTFLTALLGYRDPLSRAAGFSMAPDGEILEDPDAAAASDPWRAGDKRGHAEGELDPRIPKIMEEVMRYIRNIDINTL